MRMWLAGALVGLAGCGTPDPTADELQAEMAGYDTWAQTATWTGVQPSGGIHGAHVQIWWNDLAFDALSGDGGAEMPVGAVIVKEGYEDDAGATLQGTTAMWKVEGYGWAFGQWDADGALGDFGQPGLCTGCHDAGQDSVLTETW